MERKLMLLMVMAALVLGISATASAGNTAQSTITYAVSSINEIAVSANPATLTVSTATAGSEPGALTDTSTTYAFTTNGDKKITGVLGANMETGLTLKVQLAAPAAGGSSAGLVDMSTSAQNLVTGISKQKDTGKIITYEFTATVAAGVVTSTNKTLTLTLSD